MGNACTRKRPDSLRPVLFLLTSAISVFHFAKGTRDMTGSNEFRATGARIRVKGWAKSRVS